MLKSLRKKANLPAISCGLLKLPAAVGTYGAALCDIGSLLVPLRLQGPGELQRILQPPPSASAQEGLSHRKTHVTSAHFTDLSGTVKTRPVKVGTSVHFQKCVESHWSGPVESGPHRRNNFRPRTCQHEHKNDHHGWTPACVKWNTSHVGNTIGAKGK